MTAILGLVISLAFLVALAGGRWRGRTTRHWIIVTFAVVQTLWVVFEMFTMKVPTP